MRQILTTGSGRRWLKTGPLGIPIVAVMSVAMLLRAINVFMVGTYFVPDEYWQGQEVAHRMIYGQGHLTWEWNQRLRGALHPAILAAGAKFLSLIDIGNVDAIYFSSKAIAILTSSLGDFSTLILTSRLFGAQVGIQALLCQLLSWCYFYTMSRTLSNSMETALTSLALAYWPWPSCALPGPASYARRAVWIAAISFMIRPTGCVVFVPLTVRHLAGLLKEGRKLAAWKFAVDIVLAGVSALVASALIDRAFYGEWTFPAYNFVRFNLLGDGASIYGVHPWHWYLTQGVPGIIFTASPLCLIGIVACGRLDLFLLGIWTVGVYSILPHKEFRFVLPVQHLAFAYAGAGLAALGGLLIHTDQRKRRLMWGQQPNSQPGSPFGAVNRGGSGRTMPDHPTMASAAAAAFSGASSSASGAAGSRKVPQWGTLAWLLYWMNSLVDPSHRESSQGRVRPWLRRWGWRASVFMLLGTNMPIALYLSSLHQRGAVSVMSVVDAETRGRDVEQHVLFLMPCHSTPFYSHVGHGPQLTFLDCSPEGYRPQISLDSRCQKGRARGSLPPEAHNQVELDHRLLGGFQALLVSCVLLTLTRGSHAIRCSTASTRPTDSTKTPRSFSTAHFRGECFLGGASTGPKCPPS
jgi:hypothetical protein